MTPALRLWRGAMLVVLAGFDATVSAQATEPVPAMPVRGPDELDQLLGPIALYPDPLLAQLLPAATYPLDIVKAARIVRQGVSAEQIDQQDWDPSVKAIAHYPNVLEMMDTSIDWTQEVGQAFIAQPDDVMQAIQRLRARARDVGNLADTPEQQVLVDEDAVRIVPAEPDVLYVPVYEPSVVYYWRPAMPCITFGLGMACGTWLDLDCDWRRHYFYRPGWTWNHWRDHIVLEHGRVVRHDHRDQRPPTVWQRNQHKPSALPGRSITRPSQFDAFRGREHISEPPSLPPPPHIPSDRGRVRVPEPRPPAHAFDPRQPVNQIERYSQRGAESQHGAPAHPAPSPRVPEPAPGEPQPRPMPTEAPVRAPEPPTHATGKPVVPTPVPTPQPQPKPPPQQKPQPQLQGTHVGTPPVKIAPPPPAATAPARPTLTGGGPAAERGKNSRGHD